MNWDLNDLYLGFDDPKYKKDFDEVSKLINEYNEIPLLINKDDDLTVILKYIELNQRLIVLIRTLSSFNSLTNATDVSNQESLVNMSRLSRMLNETTATDVIFTRF